MYHRYGTLIASAMKRGSPRVVPVPGKLRFDPQLLYQPGVLSRNFVQKLRTTIPNGSLMYDMRLRTTLPADLLNGQGPLIMGKGIWAATEVGANLYGIKRETKKITDQNFTAALALATSDWSSLDRTTQTRFEHRWTSDVSHILMHSVLHSYFAEGEAYRDSRFMFESGMLLTHYLGGLRDLRYLLSTMGYCSGEFYDYITLRDDVSRVFGVHVYLYIGMRIFPDVHPVPIPYFDYISVGVTLDWEVVDHPMAIHHQTTVSGLCYLP